MTPPRTTPPALLLALALGEDIDPSQVEWATLTAQAVRDGMVLRLESWFAARGLTPPRACDAAITQARARTREVTDLVVRISAFCELRDIPYVFPKLVQSAPDVGRDLDVLLGPGLTRAIPLPSTSVPVDVQRGRLGRCGEHEAFAQRVLARRETEAWSYGLRALPCAEDRILLLALSRVYGRPHVRLSDVWVTATALRSGSIDVDRLVALAAEAGLLDGLACFLDYVDQVARRLLGEPLLGAHLRAQLPGGPWGQVVPVDGTYRGSTARVAPYLFARALTKRVLAGDLRTAGRLALLPVAIATRRGRSSIPSPPPRTIPHA